MCVALYHRSVGVAEAGWWLQMRCGAVLHQVTCCVVACDTMCATRAWEYGLSYCAAASMPQCKCITKPSKLLIMQASKW